MATQVLKFLINADNRQAVAAFSQVRNSATRVAAGIAGAFGVGLGVAGMIAFGKKVIDAADQVNELSQRLGVSTDFVQKFKYMTDQTGASVDSLGMAIKTMSKVTQSAGGAGLVSRLGLDFKEIREMKPEEAFEKIVRALGKVQNAQQRTALSSVLFGRSSVALGELISNYEKLSQEASNQPIFTAEQIKAADEFGDSLARINQSMMVAAADSGFMTWLSDVADRVEKTAALLKMTDARLPQEEQGTGKGAIAMDFTKEALRNYMFGLPKGHMGIADKTNSELFMPAISNKEVVAAINAHKESTDNMSKNLGAYP
jgi:hypothetical protein